MKKVIAFILLVLSFNYAYAANWIYIDEGYAYGEYGERYYVDTHSIVRREKTQAWVLRDFVDMGISNASLMEFDCANNTHATIYTAFYLGSMGEGLTIDFDSTPIDAQPAEGIEAKLLEFVCTK